MDGNTVRCTNCRGSKRVAKLGGIFGKCNTCNGMGTILAKDKVKPAEIIIVDMSDKELINQVADIVPTVVSESQKNDKKVDAKRAIYRKKTVK